MPVIGLSAVALEIPDLDEGVEFYTDAGLEARQEGNKVLLNCPGREREALVLVGGAERKRLHHVRMRADGLDEIRAKVESDGGQIESAPDGFAEEGLWVRDPHGMLYHLIETDDEAPLAQGPDFTINGPGHTVRVRATALPRRSETPRPLPLRLGHLAVHTLDVATSVKFATEVLGLGVADYAADVVAFCCGRKNSDHHVIGFAKSNGVGLHHVSFMMETPDAVGIAGRALAEKAGRGDWGFGRHTIGSNFFHYIQDPWGSWFEYYADMDFIDDYAKWQPSNYPLEDALHHWGPTPPGDFSANPEVGPVLQAEHA